jgi:DNA polymerase III sliding clamp (beta) subunit (PCNA family)
VLSQPWGTRIAVAAADLRQAVRVARLFSTSGTGGDARPVVLRASAGRLRLSARGDETGDAEAELPAAVEGEIDQSVVLNTRLLADVVDAADGPELVLTWRGATTPVAIREHRGSDAAEPDAGDAWAVMPLLVPTAEPAEGTTAEPNSHASSPADEAAAVA